MEFIGWLIIIVAVCATLGILIEKMKERKFKWHFGLV